MAALQHLQQSSAHAITRALHGQLLHNSIKQLALYARPFHDVALLEHGFGSFKHRQNSGDDGITRDGYLLFVEEQLHSALTEHRLPLRCVPHARASRELVEHADTFLER